MFAVSAFHAFSPPPFGTVAYSITLIILLAYLLVNTDLTLKLLTITIF